MLYFQGKTVRSYLQLIIVPLMMGTLLFLSHCNPADRYQYHYPISQETKDYCYFEAGSWWVYVDSSRMVYDTVRCIRSMKSILDGPNLTKFPFETLLISFSSSYYGFNYSYQNGSIDQFDTLVLQDFLTLHSPPEYPYYSFFFRSNKLDTFPYQESKVILRRDISHGSGFNSLLSFEVMGVFGNELPYIISWSPNVGIVYKAMPDGTHWELIDYEVLQP